MPSCYHAADGSWQSGRVAPLAGSERSPGQGRRKAGCNSGALGPYCTVMVTFMVGCTVQVTMNVPALAKT
jgi:hypothetical protein